MICTELGNDPSRWDRRAPLSRPERHSEALSHFAAAVTPASTGAAEQSITELRNRQVIAQLADRQFLPRFGLPLGVLQLRVDDSRTEAGHWSLGRSGALALREYAPGAKVLVGGRQITSRGVVKDWIGEDEQALGAQRRMLTCSEGHVYLSTGVALHDECPYCGAAPESGRAP